jgi:hypothetical protein
MMVNLMLSIRDHLPRLNKCGLVELQLVAQRTLKFERQLLIRRPKGRLRIDPINESSCFQPRFPT